jgi:hypothetical protein
MAVFALHVVPAGTTIRSAVLPEKRQEIHRIASGKWPH